MTVESRQKIESSQILPNMEAITEDGYKWLVWRFKGEITLVGLEDLETGAVVYTPIVGVGIRAAAVKGWLAARQSRSSLEPPEILAEMGFKGVDPDQKLEETYLGYGHSSVGDGAIVDVAFARIPIHLCSVSFLNLATNSGQEKSTRYQKAFGKALLHPLRHYVAKGQERLLTFEEDYQELGRLAAALYVKHRDRIACEFRKFYSFDETDAGRRRSFDSRVLDCVRYFVLWGQSTGMSIATSARDWSRVIADFKGSNVVFYQRIGAQIQRLLTPTPAEEEFLDFKAEAPSLIRHTEGNATTNYSLLRLKFFVQQETDLLDRVQPNLEFAGRVDQEVALLPREYSEGEKLVSQYLLTLWPGLDTDRLLEWVRTCDRETKERISEIIFSGHNNYKEMSTLAGTTGMTLVYKAYLGEMRDFIRHRAWGRFMPLPAVFGMTLDYSTIKQVLSKGFGLPLYLTKVPEFVNVRQEFEEDMRFYYERLMNLVECVKEELGEGADYSFVINLLPLAHQVDLWMHGDPKQALYMTHQRVRPGGHINYTDLAYQANRLVANSDPYMGMRLEKRPDPASVEQFFDRG